MRFEVDDSVYIVKIARDQEEGWSDSMDKYFLQCGVVIDVIEDRDAYEIQFEDENTYFFNADAVGDYDDYRHAKAKKDLKDVPVSNKWFISPISKTIFKFISLEPSGYSIFEDKDKNVVTNQYFNLSAAPKGCTGFDFVPPKGK